jgi:hypothetical protein
MYPLGGSLVVTMPSDTVCGQVSGLCGFPKRFIFNKIQTPDMRTRACWKVFSHYPAFFCHRSRPPTQLAFSNDLGVPIEMPREAKLRISTNMFEYRRLGPLFQVLEGTDGPPESLRTEHFSF